MTKIAGASLIGFCAVSFGADKANLNPMASQVAGFIGAFLGTLAAQRRSRLFRDEQKPKSATPDGPEDH